MARRLRYFPVGSPVEVTTRTLQGRLLLRPGPALGRIILGILGRAQAVHGLRIHAFVFLSNHYHLLCSPSDPQQLARFMCFVNSNIAREAGRLHSWREKFWSRRYQAIPVTAELAAQVERLRYILSHGVKEGFVLTPARWPGVHCIDALLHGKALRGLWFDRSAEYEARRQGARCGATRFVHVETVTLTPLPCWEHLATSDVRERVADLIAGIESEARAWQGRSGRDPDGSDFVQRQSPHQEPMRSKRTPAPLIHAASCRARRAFLAAYRCFLAVYRQAANRLREGDLSVVFPARSFPPSLPFAREPG